MRNLNYPVETVLLATAIPQTDLERGIPDESLIRLPAIVDLRVDLNSGEIKISASVTDLVHLPIVAFMSMGVKHCS